MYIDESDGIQHRKMEEKIRKEYLRRIRLLLRTELNGRNKIDLELEIQRMWQMKTEVIPVVVGVLGPIKKGMVENIKRVSERATVTETQKISMLGSAPILRKVLYI